MRGTILEPWERGSGRKLRKVKLPIPMAGKGALRGRVSTEDCCFRFKTVDARCKRMFPLPFTALNVPCPREARKPPLVSMGGGKQGERSNLLPALPRQPAPSGAETERLEYPHIYESTHPDLDVKMTLQLFSEPPGKSEDVFSRCMGQWGRNTKLLCDHTPGICNSVSQCSRYVFADHY